MAKIINLKSHDPVKGEKIFVDTNVWYWFTYVSSKQMAVVEKPIPYQMNDYPDFIERALNNGAELYHCPLTLAELANNIEHAEFTYYKTYIDNNVRKKEFRKLNPERKTVVSEIEVAWSTICSISSLLNTELSAKTTTGAISLLASTTLDTYDCFYSQLMRDNSIDIIITDDGDFKSLPATCVYTSNRNMLRS